MRKYNPRFLTPHKIALALIAVLILGGLIRTLLTKPEKLLRAGTKGAYTLSESVQTSDYLPHNLRNMLPDDMPVYIPKTLQELDPSPIVITETVPPLGKDAVRLNPRRRIDEGPEKSKIGGVFLWSKKQTWPKCDEHDCLLIPALQVRKEDVDNLPFPPEKDLMQVFWCASPYAHKRVYCAKPFVFWQKIDSVYDPRSTNPITLPIV
ncbi:MAG: hypothetical protein K2Z81_14800, partial [Cyanobacteria bacterium]|nr:hypothetical protein [Cyanobacteriota bacterium]